MNRADNGGTLGIGYAPAAGPYWSRMLGPVGGSFVSGGSYRWEPGSVGGNNDLIIVTSGEWVWHPNPGGGNPTPPAGFPSSFVAPRHPPSARKAYKAPEFCGSEGTEWVPEGNWAGACRQHDDCYGTLGSNKEICDINLGLGVLAYCTEALWNPAVCVAPSVLYWFGVTVGGWGPYLKSQRRTGGGW
jgi:hypothetical protein